MTISRGLVGHIWIIPLVFMVLAACQDGEVSGIPSPRPSERALQPSSTSSPTSSPTITYTPTLTPSPTPTPHPLTITWLRSREFPGSEITIEETLAHGGNYRRYIASYQSDGLKIYALLTVPFGKPPETGWPVILFNHGYIPPDQYRTTERYVAYVDAFARHGYIVFRPDYRGHGNSEGFARGAYGSPDYTVDVLNALAAIQGFQGADPGRIGVWGHSMGGYITLRVMVVSKDIRAGVIWAGMVASYPDLLERWSRRRSVTRTPSPGRISWRTSLLADLGSPQDNPDFWDSLSANSYLEDLSGPLQLHHGTGDSSVPVEFSRVLAESIRSVDGSVEYFEYPDDDHNLSNGFSAAMQRSIQFFDHYLKKIGD